LSLAGAACIFLAVAVVWLIVFLASESEGRMLEFPLFWILAFLLVPIGIVYFTWGLLAVTLAYTQRGASIRQILLKDRWKTKKKKIPVRKMWAVVYDLYLVIQMLKERR